MNVTARMASLSKLTSPTLREAFSKPDLCLVRNLAILRERIQHWLTSRTQEGLDGLMEKFIADVRHGRYKEEGWPVTPGYPTTPYWVSKIGTYPGPYMFVC